MRTRGRHIMVPETSQITNFRARFFYNTFLYWLTNLPIGITFFYGPVFFRRVKELTKQPSFKSVSFITRFYIH